MILAHLRTAVARYPLVAGALLGAGLLALALRRGSFELTAASEAFLLIWWVLGFGAALGVLLRAKWSVAQLVLLGALIALAGWTAISLAWTSSDQKTMAEASRIVGYVGVVALVCSAFSSEDRDAAIASITAAMVAVCGLSLLSRLAPELLTSRLSEVGFERRRLAYPFDYWNAVGCWAAVTTALCLAWAAHAERRWARSAALASVCITVPTAYLTYSRTTVVVVLVGAVAVVGLARHRWIAAACTLTAGVACAGVIGAIRAQPAIATGAGGEGAAVVGLALLVAAAACGLAAALLHGSPVERMRLSPDTGRTAATAAAATLAGLAVLAGPGLADRVWESFRGPERSAEADPAGRLTSLGGERDLLYEVALERFEARPWQGIGAGTFVFAWMSYPRRTENAVDAHSLYLESLAELGLPGALLVVVAIGAILVGATSHALTARGPEAAAAIGAAAAVTVYAVCAGVDWMWESTAVTVAALSLGSLALAGPRTPGRAPAHMRVLIALMAATAILVLAPGLIAGRLLQDSQAAARDGRVDLALRRASAAVGVEPWGARTFLQQGLVLEQTGQLRLAAAAIRRAARLEPLNWQPWSILARIEARRGRVEPALAAIRRARELNPRAPRGPIAPRR